MSAGGARPAVVIAEDDEDIALVLSETLRSDGVAEPVIVSNGALVIDAVISSGARLLILDVQLPGASGIDVYDVVRNHPALAGIAVLFVTANPELARDTLRGNAPREVLAKPFDIDELVAKVRELLREVIAA
ncbi:MAG: two-component system, OmpR family, alkaline phosphatase synthesis response regulator PhoP [Chloroflexota bacterium]|jgi:DNA-binding response OmpR family regulator|nr:two-component system, OmpR family, alkaline phosphatase synthesis response regulator PhoP [Chloroflexota bacterium]